MTPLLPFTSDELMDAFAWWLRDGGNDARGILARLHLPGTRRRVLNSLRDRQLIEAARLILPDGNHYAQAVALRHACQAFEGHLWHAWQDLPAPPDYADEARQALFWAFRFDESSIRENRPHTPADWSLSAFRKLLPKPEKECRAAALAWSLPTKETHHVRLQPSPRTTHLQPRQSPARPARREAPQRLRGGS